MVLAGLAFRSGGYFPPDYLAAGAVIYVTLAVIMLVRPPHYSLSTEALVGLVALSAFAIWSGISTTWSPSPHAGLEAMQRNLVYAGLFGLGLLAAGSGRLARSFVRGLCAAIIAVIGAAVVSRLYPQVLPSPKGPLFERLAYPLNYWNAVGALAAMGVTLTAAIAADVRLRTVVRAGSAALSVMLVAALYLTLSRGAFVALFVGAIVLIALSPRRGALVLTVLVTSILAALAIMRLGQYHALIDPPRRGDGQASAGAAYGPQLLLLMALAGLVQAGIARLEGSRRVTAQVRAYAKPVLLGLAGLLVIGVLGFSALNQARVRDWTSSSGDYVERQWNGFLSPTPTFKSALGTGRLTTAQGDRAETWRVAINAFRQHPMEGEGAGSYEARWYRERREDISLRNAHSLYLETLGELGLVGFGLLALFVASLAVAAVKASRRRGSLDAPLAAGVIATCVVWVVHAAVDWDWQVTTVSGLAILLAATLYPRVGGKARPEVEDERQAAPRLLTAEELQERARRVG